MKAILLAGGYGSRLYPVTLGISKQLLPVYDKPMVYYPLSVLLMANIKEILLISTKEDISSYKRLLGDGTQIGISIEYKVQKEPNGIAEAFILGEKFIGKDPVCLILGDNIFYGLDFTEKLEMVVKRTSFEGKGTIFSYPVNDPDRYGVIEYDKNGNVVSIEEKPQHPKSNNVVVGLYFYPNIVIEIAKKIKPSKRGELEITSINEYFLKERKLKVEALTHEFIWLDTGTLKSLIAAGQFIETIEKRKGIKVGCLEELAYQKGYINKKQLIQSISKMSETSYGKYLKNKYIK